MNILHYYSFQTVFLTKILNRSLLKVMFIAMKI